MNAFDATQDDASDVNVDKAYEVLQALVAGEANTPSWRELAQLLHLPYGSHHLAFCRALQVVAATCTV
jgi:hypothetical protein